MEELIFRPKKHSRLKHLVIAVFLAVFITLGLRFGIPVNQANVDAQAISLKSLTPSPQLSQPKTAITQTIATSRVKAAIQKVLDSHPELKFGVSLTDLDTDDHIDINGDQSFIAASTTKLITACSFLKNVQDGKDSLDEPVGIYPASYQLQQLINQSNNDSWDYFNNILGFQAQEPYAESIGAGSFKSNPNSWTANDMAKLLSQLYQGKLLDKNNTDLLLSFMHETIEERFIPPALPANAKVYHKTGNLDDLAHDGAIIDDGTHRYVLAIFSDGQGNFDYDQRAAVFHDIVKAVNPNG